MEEEVWKKKCSSCKRMLPCSHTPSMSLFHKNSNSPDGFHNMCKQCRRNMRKKQREVKATPAPAPKEQIVGVLEETSDRIVFGSPEEAKLRQEQRDNEQDTKLVANIKQFFEKIKEDNKKLLKKRPMRDLVVVRLCQKCSKNEVVVDAINSYMGTLQYTHYGKLKEPAPCLACGRTVEIVNFLEYHPKSHWRSGFAIADENPDGQGGADKLLGNDVVMSIH